MKKYFLLPLLMAFILGFSQKYDTIFYDYKWDKTTDKNYSYYRINSDSQNDNFIISKDYYKNGQLQMEGKFKSIKGKRKIGKFTWYHENGQKWHTKNYNEKGKCNGESIYWFESGNIDRIGNYSNDKKNGKWEYYFDESQKVSAEIIYKNDNIIKEEYWNLDRTKLKDISKANQPAEFPGGNDNFRKLVGENSFYPVRLQEEKIEGRVIMKFYINSDGYMEDISVMETSDERLNDPALYVMEIIKSMNIKWKPGIRYNRLMKRFSYAIPVKFDLTNNKKLKNGYHL